MARRKTRLGFEDALKQMKDGRKVYRKAWGKDSTFLFLAFNMEFTTRADLECVKHLKGDIMHDCILAKTADDRFTAWAANQMDLLAEDWIII